MNTYEQIVEAIRKEEYEADFNAAKDFLQRIERFTKKLEKEAERLQKGADALLKAKAEQEAIKSSFVELLVLHRPDAVQVKDFINQHNRM